MFQIDSAELYTDHPEGLGGMVRPLGIKSKREEREIIGGKVTPRQRKKLKKAAMISLAGWAAQRHIFPGILRHHHAQSDRIYAQDCIGPIEPLGSKSHELYLKYLFCKVDEPITSEKNWKLVKALAKELYKRKSLNRLNMHKNFDEAWGMPPLPRWMMEGNQKTPALSASQK